THRPFVRRRRWRPPLQRGESVTLAFLVLLEKLSPEERAVFLLKDIFEYGHSEVAEMLGLTVENSRQLLHRAKARLAEPRPQPALIIRVDERLELFFVFS